MALVNQAKREINAKIVFFGPGASGKATNLKHVYNKLKPEFRGAMKAMNVQNARMLFFDFTPPGDGNVDGFRVRFHVYTVSGSDVDPSAWKMVLKGVDGVVFVADSASQRQAENRESLDSLAGYLKGYGQNLSSIPTVIQFNKSDLPDALEQAELERMLNPARLPSFRASSQSGDGVLQTTLGLVKTVLTRLRDKGVEGIASGEGLQQMVQPASSAPDKGDRPVAPAQPEKPELDIPQAQAPQAQTPEVQTQKTEAPTSGESGRPSAQSARGILDWGDQPVSGTAPVPPTTAEPLSLELSGAPQAAGPGMFRLPLTIRSGDRTRNVVLSLSLSLEEE